MENSYKIHLASYSTTELGIKIGYKIHAMNVKSAKILNVKAAKNPVGKICKIHNLHFENVTCMIIT